MKRTLIPSSKTDRFAVAGGFLAIVFAPIAFIYGDYRSAFGFALSAILLFFSAYGSRRRRSISASTNEYTSVIATIGTIRNQLSELSKFLEKEQARVAGTEATLKSLQEEQSKLEPLVHTQRETVDAILAAYSERTAKSVWNERLVGFVLGIVASLIASFVYEYINR